MFKDFIRIEILQKHFYKYIISIIITIADLGNNITSY